MEVTANTPNKVLPVLPAYIFFIAAFLQYPLQYN